MSGRQGERDSAEFFPRGHRLPQFLTVGQRSVVPGSQQPVGRGIQLAGVGHQFDHVRLAVSDVHQSRVWQLRRQLGHSFIALDLARAFFDPWAPAVAVLRFACPHPRIHNPQRLTICADRVGRTHVQAALRFIVFSSVDARQNCRDRGVMRFSAETGGSANG